MYDTSNILTVEQVRSYKRLITKPENQPKILYDCYYFDTLVALNMTWGFIVKKLRTNFGVNINHPKVILSKHC